MKRTSVAVVFMLVATIGLSLVPVHATQTNTASGSVPVTDGVVNPQWWVVPQDPLATPDNRPVWVLLRQVTVPLTVTLSAHGAVLGSMDVYKYEATPDRVTHPCPQGIATMLYPDEGETAFAYLVRLRHITTQQHQTTIPSATTLDATVSVVLEPGQDYVAVFDARAGTGNSMIEGVVDAVDPGPPRPSSVTWTASVENTADFFDYAVVSPGDRPPWLRLATWADNAAACQAQGLPLPVEPPEGGPASAGGPELPIGIEDLLDAGL